MDNCNGRTTATSLLDSAYLALQKASRFLVCVLMVLMVVVVFANVITRYYLHFSLAWSEEVSRYLLIWITFLGAVLAYVDDEHLGLDMMVAKMPLRMRNGLAVITDGMVLYAIWLITEGGYSMMVDSWDWESTTIPIPLGWAYTIIPLCGGILFLQTLLKMWRHVRDMGGKSC